jgi:NAD(P)-dependent dehydrogenase (short-subunit alcohol dehydrogenase family)
VNNAGISGGGAPLELEQEDRLNSVFEVNFFGAMRMMREFLPLIRQSQGRFVTVSSLKGSIATPGSSGYCASKSAIDAATRSLGREVYHLGVKAIVVQPGYIKTDILANIDTKFVVSILVEFVFPSFFF